MSMNGRVVASSALQPKLAVNAGFTVRKRPVASDAAAITSGEMRHRRSRSLACDATWCVNASFRRRSVSSFWRRDSSARTLPVVSTTVHRMPPTVPSSSRTGLYENVNQLCSG